MDAVKLDGIVPIIPVPFTADESIDEPGLRRVVDYAVAHGAAGACLPAYGSEFYKLSDAERERVVGIAIEANRRRVPLIAQANHGAAKVAAATAQRYERMGADLISIAIPRTFGLNDADVARYLGRVAGAVGLPLLVQDFNPGGPTIGAEQI
ncbi:MAG: dihydrodipicolinate synthase family protein, partial [Actinobacteria bacterium]|nr:dihydrodipicolinate synthase family protein [Actinomycetota bacterium]